MVAEEEWLVAVGNEGDAGSYNPPPSMPFSWDICPTRPRVETLTLHALLRKFVRIASERHRPLSEVMVSKRTFLSNHVDTENI